MTYAVEKCAKPGAGGNARVWIKCSCGRRFTVRASKVSALPECRSRKHGRQN